MSTVGFRQRIHKGHSMLTAADVMTKDLVTIGPDATIKEAIDLLIDKQISGLPVVDRNHRLVGVITEFALWRWSMTTRYRITPFLAT